MPPVEDQNVLPGLDDILDSLGSDPAPVDDPQPQKLPDDEEDKPDNADPAPKDPPETDGTPPDAGDPAGDGGDPPQDPPQEDDATKLREEINRLQGELNAIRMQTPQAAPPKEPAADRQPAAPSATGDAVEYVATDFLGAEDIDLVMTDKDRLNALLNKVAKTVLEGAVNMASERTLRSIPRVVETASRQRAEIDGAVAKFYTDNPDLTPFKNAVAAAATGVHSENPAWSLDQVFAEAAKRTRTALALRETKRSTPPALPPTSGKSSPRGGTQDTRTALEKELDDLLKED